MDKKPIKHFYNEGYPTILEVHPTSKCNLDCIFCGSEKNLPNELSTKEWYLIFEEAFNSNIRHIRVVGGGEPLVRRDLFVNILQKLRKGKNQTIMLNTNFTLADNKLLEMFVKFGWDEILISIEGIGSLHNKLVGSKFAFSKVKENLKNLEIIKKQNNSILPRVVFHTVLNKLNFMHLDKLILFAKRYNVSYMNLNLIRLFSKIKNLGLNEIDMEKFRDILTHKYLPLLSKLGIPSNYSSFNLTGDKRSNPQHQNTQCLLPWFYMLISADGSIYPCCKFVGSNKERDFSKSIKHSWENSNFLNNIRGTYLKNKIPTFCLDSCRDSYRKTWLDIANNSLGIDKK